MEIKASLLIVLSVIVSSCALDDPLPERVLASNQAPPAYFVSNVEPPPPQKTYPPQAVNILEPLEIVEDALTIEFTWMENSETVAALQGFIGVTPDGVYGPRTQEAHVAVLNVLSLPTAGAPDKPSGSNAHYISPDPIPGGTFWDNVERWRPIVTEAVFAWGGDEADVHRFLRIMQCESAGLPNAKNPTSSASGLMQHLTRFWPDRAAAAGMPGADVFDPYANVWVSAWLALVAPGGGWQHWVCR